MAKAYQLTLTGSAQRLSDVYGGVAGAAPDAGKDVPYRTVVLQPQKAGHDIFVGIDNTVTSTVFGVRLDPTATTPPLTLGPYDEGPLKLSEFWVTGTAAEVLTILGIPL